MYSVTLGTKPFPVPFPGSQGGIVAYVYKDGSGFPAYMTGVYTHGKEAREEAWQWVRKQEKAAERNTGNT